MTARRTMEPFTGMGKIADVGENRLKKVVPPVLHSRCLFESE